MSLHRSVAIVLILLHILRGYPASQLDYGYHHFTEMTEYLHKITEDYANLTTLYSIGQSVNNRDLWVVKLTTAPESKLGVPNVKLIGNIHGDEGVGREVLLHLIEYFVTSYETNDTIRWLLDNTRVHILPSMNPDGFEMSTEGKCQGSPNKGRQNMNNIDLNRNFDDCVINSTMPAQPEMTAVITWLQATQFVLSASLHGGELVANYPYDRDLDGIWDAALKLYKESGDNQDIKAIWKILYDSGLIYKEYLTPDDDVFKYLAKAYAKTHPTMHLGKQCDKSKKKFKDGITNGAAWYPIKGGMQDYNYCKTGCLELTLEIGCCKYPQASQLPQLWKENQEALVQFVLHAHRGVYGMIRRGDTLSAIAHAELFIVNRTVGFQSNDKGEFWRILLPGDYQLKIHTAEYGTFVESFSVAETPPNVCPNATWLDVKLYNNPTNLNKDIFGTTEVEDTVTSTDMAAAEINETMTLGPIILDTTIINETITLQSVDSKKPIISEPRKQVNGTLSLKCIAHLIVLGIVFTSLLL